MTTTVHAALVSATFATLVGGIISWHFRNKFVGIAISLLVGLLWVKVAYRAFTTQTETGQLVLGIGRDGSDHSKNWLAHVKEMNATLDRVQYKITEDTTAGVASKGHIDKNGQVEPKHITYPNQLLPKGTEVITAFTRKEWASRKLTDVDGVPCVPIQLHVKGSKMGRFDIHNDLVYLVPLSVLAEIETVVQTMPTPAPPLVRRQTTPKPVVAAAPKAPATLQVAYQKNTVEQGLALGMDQQNHTIWTLSLSGEDASVVNVTEVPPGGTLLVSQRPGVVGKPTGVTVTVNGTSMPFQECAFQQFCSWTVDVENKSTMPQSIAVQNTGGERHTLVVSGLDMTTWVSR